MILTDTSVWIDYFNGIRTWQTNTLDEFLLNDWVLMGDIILAEILQGFDQELDYQTAKQALNTLDCVQLVGKYRAVQAASCFRFLRSRGVTIRKTIDMLIASWCIDTGTALLHNDKDFDRIARLLPLKLITP